jgi:hypothetical protein
LTTTNNTELALTPREQTLITAIRDQLVNDLNGTDGEALVVLDPAAEQVVANTELIQAVDRAVEAALASTNLLTIEREMFQFVRQLRDGAITETAPPTAAQIAAAAAAQRVAAAAANTTPPATPAARAGGLLASLNKK